MRVLFSYLKGHANLSRKALMRGEKLNMENNETVNQENATEVNESAEKTFTQAELDRIVSERLKREREKYADYDSLVEKAQKFDQIEENAKTELQKAQERAEKLQTELSAMRHAEEVRTIRDRVAQTTGVPASLLTGDTEEDCTEQANGILSFKSSMGYPQIKDGGEIQLNNKLDARTAFSEWASQVNN